MLSIKNVTIVEKSGKQLLNNVSLEVREGDFMAVSGNPVQSETLIAVLGGLQSVTSGEVIIDGIEISKYTLTQLTTLRREKFAYFLSDSIIDESLTVRENVELPLLIADVEPKQMDARVERAVQIVGMADFIDIKASLLTDWQKNKLMFALMLVKNPQVMIVNEPLRVMDLSRISEITGLFSALNKEGITIILASGLEEICAVAKRRIEILEDGTITEIKKERATRTKTSEEKPKTKRTVKARKPKEEKVVKAEEVATAETEEAPKPKKAKAKSKLEEVKPNEENEEIPELDVKPVKTRKPRTKKVETKE